MEKTQLLGIDMTQNERKTVIAFIEINQGVPTLVKRSLKEICKKTNIINPKKRNYRVETNKKRKSPNETDPGYQFIILNRLKNKGVIDKDKDGYFLKPKHQDIAYSSLIQNQLKNLEDKGLFRQCFTVFGIKKEWWKYPEFQYLHDAMFDSLCSHYRIKQVKAIFLIRDFSKQWKKFLDSNIHPAVKYWLWKRVCSKLYSSCDKKDEERYVDEPLELVKILGVSDKNELEKYRSLIKKQFDNNEFIQKSRKQLEKAKEEGKRAYNINLEKYESSIKEKFDNEEKVSKKMKEYNAVNSMQTIDFIENNLKKNQKKIILNILEWISITYPTEINNTAAHVDIGSLSGSSAHIDIAIDENEKCFRNEADEFYLRQMNHAIKDLKEKTIDDTLQRILDIYDDRNRFRFLDRLGRVILQQIAKPDYVVFSNSEIEKLKKEIINLAKESMLRVTANLHHKPFKTDEEIFSFLEYEFYPNLPRYTDEN